MSITPQEALQRTIEHREIFYDEMLALIRQIMAGEISPACVSKRKPSARSLPPPR